MIANILYKIKLQGEKKSFFKPNRKGKNIKIWTSNCAIMWIKWWGNTTTIIHSKSTRWETIAPKLLTNPLTYNFRNKHILHPRKPNMQKYWSGLLGLWMSLPLWKQEITCNMQNVFNWLENVQISQPSMVELIYIFFKNQFYHKLSSFCFK